VVNVRMRLNDGIDFAGIKMKVSVSLVAFIATALKEPAVK
jgi:hypothetical protein